MENIHTFAIPAYKESKYLEEVIKSVLNQSRKSNVIITTSTPNKYIDNLAKKYNIDVFINNGKKGIGYDFDFAIKCSKTPLVTVAHQDDIYDYTYAENVINAYNKCNKANIIFTDYYEIKHDKKVKWNTNLFIKRILLIPARFHFLCKYKHVKRNILRFGNAISCPTVTFVKDNIPDTIFGCDLKCNVDYYAWEKLSKEKGYFYFVNKILMGHRIYNESTTSEIINDNKRTNEDYIMFCKFWPKWFAKIISKIYSKSEASNKK